jgi:hypothetical protein
LELQKPVDRRFKSDYPHTLILVAVALFLLAFPVVPWAKAVSEGNQTSVIVTPVHTNVSTNSASTASTCLDGSGQPVVPSTTRIAVIQPIFTATPYSQYIYGSFYAFYSKHASANLGANITTDLKLLNTSIASGIGFNFGWGHSYPLYSFLKSKQAQNCGVMMGKNAAVVSDINVTDGELFNANGSAKYDVAVVGFAEYVSLQEYNQLKQFVASGGRLLIMGGDGLQVQVKYNPTTGFETYVIGHGFAYNGKTAWRTDPATYRKGAFDNTLWIGAYDCCFRNGSYSGALVNRSNVIGAPLAAAFGDTVFKQYVSHEDNAITNISHTSVVAMFRKTPSFGVAAFVHQYRKGAVICLCVFGDDIISTDQSLQYFAILAIGTPLSALSSVPPVSQASTSILIRVLVVVAAMAAVAVVLFLVGRRRGR